VKGADVERVKEGEEVVEEGAAVEDTDEIEAEGEEEAVEEERREEEVFVGRREDDREAETGPEGVRRDLERSGFEGGLKLIKLLAPTNPSFRESEMTDLVEEEEEEEEGGLEDFGAVEREPDLEGLGCVVLRLPSKRDFLEKPRVVGVSS
jgi:hypothetical protein